MTEEKLMSLQLENGFKIYTAEGSGVVLSGFNTDAIEIIEITSGYATVEVGTEATQAVAGDFIYLPKGLVYRVDSGDEKISLRALRFERAMIEEHMENFDLDVFYMFDIQSRSKIYLFGPEHPIYETIAFSVSEAYEEFLSKDSCYKLPVRANIFLLSSALVRHYLGAKDEFDRMVYHNVMRLRPTLDYINENCGEKIYIETLAEMISVSPDYFTKVFKESIGKTPIDYINGVRVNRALELLSVTDTPINEIAEISGFANSNYFHKIFKQYMSTSPLAYRKSLIK